MVKSKILSLVILGSTIMTYKPAEAFWPVMDFGEIPVIVSNVTTSLNALSETKAQLMQLNETLDAIGKGIDNISQFGQDLRDITKDIKDVANDVVGGVNENLGTNIEIPENVNNGFDSIDKTLGEDLNNILGDTQTIIDKGSESVGEGVSGIGSAQDTANKANEEMKKLEEKNEEAKKQQEQTKEPVEEEEEEEEIPEDELEIQKEEILANIELFEEESKQLIAQMNDVLDTAIRTLNKVEQDTNKKLSSLEEAIKTTDQLATEDKDLFLGKIANLKLKHQNLADRTIAMTENAKETYNVEYQNKFIDELTAYKNVVESYFRGDADKAMIAKKGEELKLALSQIDVKIDKTVLAQQRKEIENIKKEMKSIAEEIGTKKKP